MKLIGLVFLGLLASAVFYFPVFILVGAIFSSLEALPGDFAINVGDGGVFLVTVFLVMPIAFLLGSIVTGYFSYYDIENKWLLLLMAPVLYLDLLWICVAAIGFALDAFIGVNRPAPGFVKGVLTSVAIGLLWYLGSLAGVVLGYHLRERFAKWRYGD